MKQPTTDQMKRWLIRLTISIPLLLAGYVGLRTIVELIPLAWLPKLYSMPTIEHILASENTQAATLTSTYSAGDGILCVATNWPDVMTTYTDWVRGDFSDLQRQRIVQYEAVHQRSSRFIIDGRPYLGPKILAGNSNIPLGAVTFNWNRCAEVSSLAPGRYVAQFSFETPSDETYSYTWVFERTADGVIPEVTDG